MSEPQEKRRPTFVSHPLKFKLGKKVPRLSLRCKLKVGLHPGALTASSDFDFTPRGRLIVTWAGRGRAVALFADIELALLL